VSKPKPKPKPLRTLPKIETLIANYPNALALSEIAELVGGQVGKNILDTGMPDYKNTCAIRVSRSLNYSGAQVDPALTHDRANRGADHKWYIYGVADLHHYLTAMYGPPVEKKGAQLGDVTAADLAGEHGIIEFDNYHMDLWDGTGCVHHCYFEHVSKVFLWKAETDVSAAQK
jgi:hypothetical protein